MATGFQERPIARENLISVSQKREELKERVTDIRRDEPFQENNFSVGFYDIDESLKYYFDNVLKPTVLQNGENTPVPVMYGDPERWKAMERDGYYRDNKSKLILPLIMYRRTNVQRWDQLYWPRLDQLYILSKMKWSRKKSYSDFEIKQREAGKNVETDKYSLTMIPNYLMINYDVVVWTSQIQQVNNIMEKVIFSEGTYWGDPKKFKFRCEVDGFDNAVDMASNSQRMVRATFGITCYGYVLPGDFNDKVTNKISLSPKKLTFNIRTIE